MESPASLLRSARAAAGLTQAEVARRAATSQSAVARYERATTSPSVRTLERLLHASGCRLVLSAEPAGTASDLSGSRMRRLRAARPEIERAVRIAGAANARVFGSVARGEDRVDSDVDLLVDFDVRAHGLLPLIALRRELSALLGERVDVATLDLLEPEIAQRVRREAVPL